VRKPYFTIALGQVFTNSWCDGNQRAKYDAACRWHQQVPKHVGECNVMW